MSTSSGTQFVHRNRIISQTNVASTQHQNSAPVNSHDGIVSRKNTTATRRKRKFPGPAGLLPDLEPDVISNLNILGNNPVSNTVAEIIMTDQQLQDHMQKSRETYSLNLLNSSQNEKDHFLLLKHPWRELLQQIELTSEFSNNLVDCMNINWVKTTASQLVHCQKLPFLAVVLHEAPELPSSKHGQKKTPCVKLLDATGTIEAALDPLFVKRNGRYLQPGTALSLKNVGLLRHKRRLILTVSSKNVIYMASKISDVVEESPPSSQPSEEDLSRANTGSEVTIGDKSELNPENHRHFRPQDTITTENGVTLFKFNDYSHARIMDAFKNLTDPRTIRQQYEQLQQDAARLNNNNEELQGNSRISSGTSNGVNNASNNRTNIGFGNSSKANSNSRKAPLFTHVSSSSSSPFASSSTATTFNGNKVGPSVSNGANLEDQDSEAMSNFDFNFEDDDEDDEFFRAFDLEVQELPDQNKGSNQNQNQNQIVQVQVQVQGQQSQQVYSNANFDSRQSQPHSQSQQEPVQSQTASSEYNNNPSQRMQQSTSQSLNLHNLKEETADSCLGPANVNDTMDFDDFEDEFDKELAAFDETMSQNVTSEHNSSTRVGVRSLYEVESENQADVSAGVELQDEPQVETEKPVDNDDDDFFNEFDMELDAV